MPEGPPPPLAKILVEIDCGPVGRVGSAARRRLRGVGGGYPEVRECPGTLQTSFQRCGRSLLSENHSFP